MKFNLKNRKGCCLHGFSIPKYKTHLYDCQINEWFEGFEERQKDNYNNPEDWVTQNFPLIMQHYGYKKPSEVTFEDVIQFYIRKEFLGE